MRFSTIITALLAVLLGLGAIWWFNNWEHVSEHVYKGLKGEAAEDPYLAMKRFLARMNVQVEERKPAATAGNKFGAWQPGGTVMLGDRRHVVMTQERVAQVLAWVEHGGHLIVEAEFPGRPDPLLTALDFERKPQPRPPRPVRADPKAPLTAAERQARWAERITDVSIPGNPRVLQVEFSPYQSLADPKNHAQWKVENALGVRMLHQARGAGQITVVSNFDWLTYNGVGRFKDERTQPTNIGKLDHAELLMTLLRLNPEYAKHPLRLIWGNDQVSLWEMLAREAWMALAAFAALVLLWLARVIPRFGPLQPEPPPAEQRLAAHLEASGRFFWKYLDPHAVYAKLRSAFDKRLKERRPGLAARRPGERNMELARLISVREEAVARALDTPVQNATEFVRNVRVLQRLLEKL
ncbi:MAG TPA: DUF4350 domain-containing protein [Burkholderiales bacterium]|jgi:hypothetical protein|nr:DUF4350 domain-containing protein [Burkholderiales bacterium]